MSKINTFRRSPARRNTFRPRLVRKRTEAPPEAYEAALQLVALIEQHLSAGTRHYRTKSGELLRTLDQVINAILEDNLLLEAEDFGRQELARAA